MKRLTIVIPTYNEADNIEKLLRALSFVAGEAPGFEITAAVVDDSSPDGTADRARRVGEELDRDGFRVRVEVKAEKRGLGAAYVWAFERFLSEASAPDYVLQMDADLSHDPSYVPKMLAQVDQGADLVVASRYIPGGSTPDWTFKRKLLSTGGNLYTRLFLGSRITDWTGGFNLYSSDLLRSIDPASVTSTGYGFQIDLKHRALRRARLVREVPIVFLDRTEGVSKIPSDTLATNLLLVLQLRFRRR